MVEMTLEVSPGMLTFALDPSDARVFVDDTASNMDYFCPTCGSPVIPRKGEVRRHHFAHKGGGACSDGWARSYDDSEWHHLWQERFPKENQEVTLTLGDIRHRADVLTGVTVVEFQKSALTPEQFNDRNTFYQDLGYKVVWLYDLRDTFREGGMREESHENGSYHFSWDNPRKAFRAYDLVHGNVDLFLQLRDECDGPCIVRPEDVSTTGFESFRASRWLSAEDFLRYVGMRDGRYAPPELRPLEPNEAYLRFKQRYDIELSRQQERAAQVVDGATLLVAVPGSGKTTVIVARLGYLALERGIAPESIACITYTNAAADEMRTRFSKKFGRPDVAGRITFCTINKLAKDIYEDSCRRKGEVPRRVDPKAVRAILLDACRRARGGYVSEGDLVELENAIAYVKNMMLLDDVEAIAGITKGIERFEEILALYQDGLMNHGLMDFDDQILLAFDALDRDRELWWIYRSRFRYWCVDEAQDTSRIQHNLVYRLAGGGGNVFMVGDEDQSIFGYRGAYPKAMLNFKYAYRNAFVLKMERNYRSGEEIVSAARRFISRNTGRIDKAMVADRGGGATVRTLAVESRSAQWQAVHDLALSREGEVAVLFRNNDIAIPLVDRLLRDGLPFAMRRGKRTFFDSAIVRDVRAFFDLAGNPRDADAFMRVYFKAHCFIKRQDAEWAVRKARRGKSDILESLVEQMSGYRRQRDVERDTANAEEFATLIRGMQSSSPAEALSLLSRSGYADYLEETGQSSTKLEILKDLAERVASTSELFRRLEELDAFFSKPGRPKNGTRLTLSSVHSAKGLEFDTVIIMDAVDGTFPSTAPSILDRSKDSAATYQEERRLFYVAMTRARNELVLLRPKGERTPFVDEIVPREARRHKKPAPAEQTASLSGAEADNSIPVRKKGTPERPATRPSEERYDIDRWEVMERLPGGRRIVTNGDMDAMVTELWGIKTVEMVVDLTPEAVTEAARHIDELSYGATKFTLCLSATAAQEVGAVTLALLHEQGAVVRVAPGLASCLDGAGRLMQDGVPLTMTIRNADGEVIGRGIESVDHQSLIIKLSGDDLGIY